MTLTLKPIQFLSPASVREGFINHEDPLGEELGFAEGYRRVHEKSDQLNAFATLFNEIPVYPTPEKAREILTKEGYHLARVVGKREIWDNNKGIIADFQISGSQAVIHFEFQTLWVTPIILNGNRSPFNLANGDVVFLYSIFAEPGVLTMLRQVQPYVLIPWRAKSWRQEEKGDLGYLKPLHNLKEFGSCVPADENLSLKEMMALSGQDYEVIDEECLKTTDGGATRLWFKPLQSAIAIRAQTKAEAKPWLDFYHLLASHAHANGCRLTERNANEIGLTGKLCCEKIGTKFSSLKVQLANGQPTILNYCDPSKPELPNL
jgi:hypothetical protein